MSAEYQDYCNANYGPEDEEYGSPESNAIASYRSENARLRQALARIERVLQPVDHALHAETVGLAREIAIAALNIQHEGERT
jgi:hypothetical protein